MTHPAPPETALAPARPLPPDAAEGLAFHRLVFARRRAGWWTPLVTGLLAVAFYVVLILVVLAVVIVALLFDPNGLDKILAVSEDVRFDLTDPLMVAVMLGSIAVMLPAYVLASLIVNGRRVGLISSAMGRLRWRWMLACGGVAVVLSGILTAIGMLLPAEEVGPDVVAPQDNPYLWATLAVILLIVPVQAAAEEYVFRGYLMQAIGRWLRHPAFAILLPVPLFVFGHLYDPLGQVSVGLFAITAGWLTWRTGGLEAAIALHVVNNLLAFLQGLAGLSDVNAASPGVASFVWSTALVGGYVAVIELLQRRARLPRTLRMAPPAAHDTPEF